MGDEDKRKQYDTEFNPEQGKNRSKRTTQYKNDEYKADFEEINELFNKKKKQAKERGLHESEDIILSKFIFHHISNRS